jgi:hypothetical protein
MQARSTPKALRCSTCPTEYVRTIATIALLVGCAAPERRDPFGDCEFDSECFPEEVCARNDECMPPDRVRVARVTWTVAGAAASDTTCATIPDLLLWFRNPSSADKFGFEPVPCHAGLFTVDKAPLYYDRVSLGVRDRYDMIGYLDAEGQVTFDLTP